MQRDDRVYLLHMRDAAIMIATYLAGIDAPTFHTTRLVQDGVIRQLEIIGEAAKQVTDRTRRRAPSIPWRSMAGMRDKLIHQYFGVDLDQVWLTATDDVPFLLDALLVLLAQWDQDVDRAT